MYYKKFRHFGLPQQFQVSNSKFQIIFVIWSDSYSITNSKLRITSFFHIPLFSLLDFGRKMVGFFIQFQVSNSKFQNSFCDLVGFWSGFQKSVIVKTIFVIFISDFGRKMVGFLFNYEFQITNYEFFSYSTIFTIRF